MNRGLVAVGLGSLVLALGAAAGQADAAQGGNYTDVKMWVSEVIGYNGRVDLVLGKFSTYKEASDCSLEWSQQHPNDLRLTREREITVRIFPPAKSPPQPPQPSTPPITDRPSVPAPRQDRPLGNSLFEGTEALQGYGKLTFFLRADGTAVMRDARSTEYGTWRANGSSVTLSFFNGQVTYTGTWSGDRLAGNATNGRDTWSWTTNR